MDLVIPCQLDLAITYQLVVLSVLFLVGGLPVTSVLTGSKDDSASVGGGGSLVMVTIRTGRPPQRWLGDGR